MSEPRFDPTGFTIQCSPCLRRKEAAERVQRDQARATWQQALDAWLAGSRVTPPPAKPGYSYGVGSIGLANQLEPFQPGLVFNRLDLPDRIELRCIEPGCNDVLYTYEAR